jgi:hypothetical protein
VAQPAAQPPLPFFLPPPRVACFPLSPSPSHHGPATPRPNWPPPLFSPPPLWAQVAAQPPLPRSPRARPARRLCRRRLSPYGPHPSALPKPPFSLSSPLPPPRAKSLSPSRRSPARPWLARRRRPSPARGEPRPPPFLPPPLSLLPLPQRPRHPDATEPRPGVLALSGAAMAAWPYGAVGPGLARPWRPPFLLKSAARRGLAPALPARGPARPTPGHGTAARVRPLSLARSVARPPATSAQLGRGARRSPWRPA